MSTDMQVTLLTTSIGCAKCEKAKEQLTALQESIDFALAEIDITEHPEKVQEYDLAVSPGIVINDELVFQGVPNQEELEDALREAAQ